jgi:coniferyl-aldehyde dehydrogenase
MEPERRGGVFPFNVFGARVAVRHDPKGVVGVLGTWAVPLFTTLAPLAFVLAAGNRAMLKPSEWVPRTSALLAEAVGAGFGEDELAVFTGGPEVAARFSADLPLAAHRIVLGKIMNSGQICVAPDVVHVPAEHLEDFLGHCVNAFQRAFADPGARGLRYTPTALLAEASARGVRLVHCSESGAGGPEPRLTLAIDPPADTRLAREEIFGPVLQVQSYGDIDEAIGRVNDAASPLALYYFGRDRREEQRVLDRTRSGGVTVNDVLMHVAAHDAPFGGVGGSGMGCYHGREGFLEFSHARTVYRSGWCDPRRILGLEPPYDARTYARLRGTLRR